MKTPQEWMDEHGYDRGVCMGHGDFSTEPRRLTLELIARIQADAQAALRPEKVWCRVQQQWVTR